MLYAIGENKKEFTWHIGEETKHFHRNAEVFNMVQADGDELMHIVSLFGPNMPVPTGKRVVRWYGDFARTILGNL